MAAPAVSVLASHSALDVLDGAKDEGLKTIAVAKRGRDRPYREFPVVDELIIVDEWIDMLSPHVLDRLRDSVFVPNRSFAVYIGYDNIENRFPIRVFGNRRLLRWEERGGEANYYRLLDEAGIRRPRTFASPDEVDRPVIVKLPEAARRVERGFFVAVDRDDLMRRARRLAERGIIRMEDLAQATIEELVLGAYFNANFFYSPLRRRLELFGFDRRIQSNLDVYYRLPPWVQEAVGEPRLIEVGHEPATIRESLLEKVFEIGYRFVEATKRLVPPGVIGPFALQLIVTPELDLVVYDVAPRIGGGQNIYMGVGSQYSKLYFGKPISLGRRIAMEIREAAEQGRLDEVVT